MSMTEIKVDFSQKLGKIKANVAIIERDFPFLRVGQVADIEAENKVFVVQGGSLNLSGKGKVIFEG